MSAEPVVVVDGDPAVRDSLRTLLDLNGFPVRTYPTGASFLRDLNQGVAARCVVCEADLPDTSGIEIYRDLVSRAGTQAPFVLLVSRRNALMVQTARKAGIANVFPKPLLHRHLLEFISSKAREVDGCHGRYRPRFGI